MRERPVLCSASEVRGLLDGSLTSLVRYMKPQPSRYVPGPNVHAPKHDGPYFDAYCGEQKTKANPRGMSDRWCWWSPDDRQGGADWIRCPFGQPGDRLWVRETWGRGLYHGEHFYNDANGDSRSRLVWEEIPLDDSGPECPALHYFADGEPGKSDPDYVVAKYPSVHMPRWASRLTLDVTNVRAVKSPDGVWSWAIDCKRAEVSPCS